MRVARIVGLLSVLLIAPSASAFRPDPVHGYVSNVPSRIAVPATWTTPSRVAPAFERFTTALGAWQAVWDRDTEVPIRLWGPSVPVAGAQRSAAIAAFAARTVIANHLDLLAPGTTVDDLELIGNAAIGDLRTVTFAQRWNGMRVVGATIRAMFKHDRLIMLGSTAKPDVSAYVPLNLAPPTSDAATRWIADDTGIATTVVTTAPAPVVHVTVRGFRDIHYVVARPIVVEANDGEVGKWSVWIDEATGVPIARASRLMMSTGDLLINTPNREAPGPRGDVPAAYQTVMVDGVEMTTDHNGRLTWPGTAAASVITSVIGPHVEIVDQSNPLATTTLSLADGGTATWMQADEFGDGQVTVFAHTNLVKRHIRHYMNPWLPWVDGQISISVNENQYCNAFADLEPDSLHFFRYGTYGPMYTCENTGRMPDVVYHENGHNFHYRSMLATGAITSIDDFFNSQEIRGLSEGLADTLSTAMTYSPIIGPGFFTHTPQDGIRHLDPMGVEKQYPDDITGQPHSDGEIIGGTIWDLRKALVAQYGMERGNMVTDRVFHGVISNSVLFAETYADAIAADDDDGDLANGTPNICEISRAFALHGFTPSLVGGVAIGTPSTDGTSFTIPITAPATDCPGPAVTAATVRWQVRGDASRAGTTSLTASGATWSGPLPIDVVDAVLQYQIDVMFDDGTMTTRSLNAADPYYEAYVGNVTTIACHDFETDHGWTHAATTGTDEWTRGAGGTAPAAGDPDGAVSGSTIFGTDLDENGLYAATSDTYAESPAIDVTGFSEVRLQYRRWLDVDDSQFDSATISVGGTELWRNATDATTPVAHRDREWRFHDVDLTAQAASGSIQVRYGLTTDDTTSFGGWNLDDVCIVGRAPTCGDAILRDPEVCDDGNTVDGDGCSALCEMEPPDEGGCCSTGSDPRGAILIGGLALLGVLRRRRRA